MEKPRTKYVCHHEEYGNSRIQGSIDDSKHLGLANSAGECEAISNEVKFTKLYLS